MSVSANPNKPLPHPGPRTNAPFEEMYQNPRSEYSLSMIFLVALMATGEMPVKGDKVYYNDAERMWTFSRPGNKERRILVQLAQVTSGGSLQFRVLDLAQHAPWKSAYVPTAALVKANDHNH